MSATEIEWKNPKPGVFTAQRRGILRSWSACISRSDDGIWYASVEVCDGQFLYSEHKSALAAQRWCKRTIKP